MVEYQDHAIIAQMGTADMRLPIQYALSYPHRLKMENELLSVGAGIRQALCTAFVSASS